VVDIISVPSALLHPFSCQYPFFHYYHQYTIVDEKPFVAHILFNH